MGGGDSRLLSIQYLRAAAALMVVVYHAMRWTRPSFEIGAAGVDVFFVISGFILWTLAQERPTTAKTFLVKRWVRVAPLYWVLTLIVAGLAWTWPELIWDAHVDPVHLLLSLAFIQHLNLENLPFPVITAGWSLNYEAVFYLIFAGSLLVKGPWRIHALTGGLAAVPMIGLLTSFAGYDQVYYLGANMMFLQFIAGVWLAQARLNGKLPGRRTGWLLFAAGIIGFAMLSPFGLFRNDVRPLLWGAPAFLLVAGLVSVESNGGLFRNRILVLLGDASFSIYLVHVVAVQLMSHVFRTDHLTFIPIAIAGGIACYYLVERPLIGLFQRKKAAIPAK